MHAHSRGERNNENYRESRRRCGEEGGGEIDCVLAAIMSYNISTQRINHLTALMRRRVSDGSKREGENAAEEK